MQELPTVADVNRPQVNTRRRTLTAQGWDTRLDLAATPTAEPEAVP